MWRVALDEIDRPAKEETPIGDRSQEIHHILRRAAEPVRGRVGVFPCTFLSGA